MSDQNANLPQRPEPNNAWSAESGSAWTTNPSQEASTVRQNPYGDTQSQPEAEPSTTPTAPQQTTKPTRTGVGDFVPQSQEGPQIQQYKRGSLWTIIIPLVVLLAAAGLVWYGTRPPEVPTDPSASPSITPYRQRTPTATNTGLPNQADFISNRVEGTFYVDSASWNGNELTVEVRVDVRQGTLANCRFSAMDISNGVVLRSSSVSGDIAKCGLSAGQGASGTVKFNKERGATQIAFSDSASSGSLAIIRVPG